MSIDKKQYLDGTRLSDNDRKELLCSLSSSTPPRNSDKRLHVRYGYAVSNVQVTVQHTPGSQEIRFLMHGRNLSCGGVSLLHGGFLHKGTACRVTLQMNDGSAQMVLGKVVSCRYITRNVHEINIQFNEKIDVMRFCAPDAEIKIEGGGSGKKLTGLALCLCSHDSNRRQLTGWLGRTGLEVVEARSVGEASDKLKRLPFSLALCDGEGGDWTMVQAVSALREAGFSGKVVLIGDIGLAGPEVAATLKRPIDEPGFIKAISSLELDSAESEGSRIFSTLAADPDTRRLLPSFVEQARGIARTMERAMMSDDRGSASAMCQSLKSVAGGYGFGEVGKAAASALLALERSKALADAAQEIGLVISLCKRLCAAEPPASKAA